MVTDVDYTFEWAVANRLNKIEWLLLGSYKWGNEWHTRFRRLKILTELGHRYSLLIGADSPIGNIQQHGWFMVNVRLPFHQQTEQIKTRVDWIFSAGFDFLTTESGLSEFTHPECGLMVDLMNVFAQHVNETWGREAGIKVHCSTGQHCDDFLDPRTGQPLNFNFLPTHTHKGLGVFPHTVQVYALDDPTAYAYGNENFSYVEDYLVYEAKLRNRSVTFYGETAYWVNVDIDVPLFLPIYGQRRQHDLRRIAVREIREDFRINGQINFDSGWEWGYWLGDVVTARASWNPLLPSTATILQEPSPSAAAAASKQMPGVRHQHHEQQPHGQSQAHEGGHDPNKGQNGSRNKMNNDDDNDDDDIASNERTVRYEAKEDQWHTFATSLRAVTHIFGPDFGERLNELLVDLSRDQADLLILGRVDPERPCPNIRRLSGMAYMSGGDTWVDVPRMLGMAFTQPDKVHLRETDDPDWPHVMSLLQAMNQRFGGTRKAIDQLYADVCQYRRNTMIDYTPRKGEKGDGAQGAILFEVNDAALNILSELKDCVAILSLRAKQLYTLYQSRDPVLGADPLQVAELQRQSRETIHQAEAVVRRREAAYRVPWQRVGEWRENPTVYRFGYLWAVHSLFYWWRDQGLAERGSFQSEHSPCYLNRYDTSEVAMGWGKVVFEVIRLMINRYTPFHSGASSPLEFVNCLSPPVNGYEFPKDLYHFD